jgi:SHS2 domain-containing protein
VGTYTIFDHTADVGLEVRGTSFEDLLATAARATFDQALEDRPAAVDCRREVRVRPVAQATLEGDRHELLVGWLQELLYLFETEHLVPLEYDFVAAGPREIKADVGFGRFEPGRHRTRLEVKAVTYHQIEVREAPDGWHARFILDI